MIERKRLEELIGQKAIIWCICDYTYDKSKPNKKIEYYDLSNEDICISPAEFRDYGLRIFNSLGYWNDIRYEDLFETKEEAEWQAEFGCIERTERLVLPTWKQIENIINQKKKFGLNHSDRVFARIITSDSIYYFKVCKDLDLFTLQVKQTYIGDDLCEQITTRFPYIFGKATKENYTLACRKAKELFLNGDEK